MRAGGFPSAPAAGGALRHLGFTSARLPAAALKAEVWSWAGEGKDPLLPPFCSLFSFFYLTPHITEVVKCKTIVPTHFSKAQGTSSSPAPWNELQLGKW